MSNVHKVASERGEWIPWGCAAFGVLGRSSLSALALLKVEQTLLVHIPAEPAHSLGDPRDIPITQTNPVDPHKLPP